MDSRSTRLVKSWLLPDAPVVVIPAVLSDKLDLPLVLYCELLLLLRLWMLRPASVRRSGAASRVCKEASTGENAHDWLVVGMTCLGVSDSVHSLRSVQASANSIAPSAPPKAAALAAVGVAGGEPQIENLEALKSPLLLWLCRPLLLKRSLLLLCRPLLLLVLILSFGKGIKSAVLDLMLIWQMGSSSSAENLLLIMARAASVAPQSLNYSWGPLVSHCLYRCTNLQYQRNLRHARRLLIGPIKVTEDDHMSNPCGR